MRYLRVHGVVYECTLVYAQDERLDPLAELIYEALTHERDIEKLSEAFGLSANLIDSILVDLVRRGFAALDIAHNQLLRIENPSARPNYRDGRSERIWHDLFTGGIVLESHVHPFYRRSQRTDQEQLIHPPPDVPDFMRMSNAQIIAQLVRAEPTLEWQEGRSWRLDRIAARGRVEGRTLWIPIDELDLFGETIDLVQQQDIPMWMTRSWTNALARTRPGGARSILPSRGRSHPDRASDQDRVVDLLACTSLAESLDRWSSAVAEVLDRSPHPVGFAEIGELATEEARLTRTIDARLQAEIGASNALDGLAAAKRSALVVLDEWREDAVLHIAGALTSFASSQGFVDLGVLVPGGRGRLVPALLACKVDPEILATRLVVDELRDGVRCSCVVLDETEIRLAASRSLQIPGGWLRLAAPPGDDLALAKAFRASIGARCRTEEFSAWLRQRSIERARRRLNGNDLDRPFAVASRLRDLVVGCDDQGKEDASLRECCSGDADAIEAAMFDACASVKRRLENDRLVVYRGLEPTERVELLFDVLRRAANDGGAGTLVFGVRAVGSLSRDAAFVDWIGAVVQNGWRIEFSAPGDVARELVAMLGARVPAERVAQLNIRPPSAVDLSFLAIRDWVCVSTLDWLDADVDAPCWTVLIEARELLSDVLEPKQR